jgi:hypothetical protein
MADKKYTGPERRSKYLRPTRRRIDRDVNLGRRLGNIGLGYDALRTPGPGLRTEVNRVNIGEVDFQRNADSGVRGPGQFQRGIVELKETVVPNERRVQGAGRRKGDLKRALKTGEPVVFDLDKTVKSAFTGVGKLAKKVISKKLKLGP